MEPRLPNGRLADIEFELYGHSYLVECYVPRGSGRNDLGEIQNSFRKIMDGLKQNEDERIVVFLRLKKQVSAAERKNIERQYFATVRLLADRDDVGFEDECASVWIKRVTAEEIGRYVVPVRASEQPRPLGDADAILRKFSTTGEGIRAIREGRPEEGTTMAVLLVWGPPDSEVAPDLRKRMDELVDKISAKLVQTRRDDDPGRIIIVGVPEAESRSTEVSAAMQDLGARLVKRHGLLAAALLVSRVWLKQSRFGYVGYVMFGDGDHSLPSSVFQSLQSLEYGFDILQDH